MKSTKMMYVRPGNLIKEFIIEDNRQVVTSTGRVADSHLGNGVRSLKGFLAEASQKERENHSQKDHVVTHTIVQAGEPRAKRGDRLVFGERIFYITDRDEVGMLGISTIYYAEERRDVK